MINVLFLCMGNICRSPAAHCVLQNLVNISNLSSKVRIDSAGTTDFHNGSPPDKRMQKCLKSRKIPIIGNSRKITKKDLDFFDLIIPMDYSNFNYIKDLDKENYYSGKITLFTNFCNHQNIEEIPDPYYNNNFEYVLDLIEEGCVNILNKIKKKL